jgi:class 3 adenylate cyclase
MTTPQIQYVRTEDGVSIAYTTVGAGPPVLFVPPRTIGMQHMLSDTAPGIFSVRELAARTRLTIFDAAGIGASQRVVSDFSLDAQARQIEAVAARISDGPFTLVGWSSGSGAAALYTTRHPERVRDLACAFPTPLEGITDEIRRDWSRYRRHLADTAFPDGPVSAQRWYGNAIKESGTAEVHAAYMEEFERADFREVYRAIPVPTLLCIVRTGPSRETQLALASVVPNCRVVSPDGEDAMAPVLEFIGVDRTAVNAPHAGPATARSTAVILFTDIVSSTELTERMGDARFRDVSRALDAGLRAAMRDAGGTPVEGKVLGDGVMGVFTSASQAIAAARRCIELSGKSELQLHVGLHAGDVIHEKGNVYGGAVNIASRICGLSAPGEILVSDVVRGMARTSAMVVFEDRGDQEMKGVSDAVRVYAVRKETA